MLIGVGEGVQANKYKMLTRPIHALRARMVVLTFREDNSMPPRGLRRFRTMDSSDVVGRLMVATTLENYWKTKSKMGSPVQHPQSDQSHKVCSAFDACALQEFKARHESWGELASIWWLSKA